MSTSFPTRYELKWTGYSLITAQLLWLIVLIGYAIYKPGEFALSVYNIKSEEQVVALHQVLASDDNRIVTKICATMFWISFPFYLIAIYGIKKILLSLFTDTPMEMWIYVLEKSYLFSVVIINLIVPAIG
eukprot:437783_1